MTEDEFAKLRPDNRDPNYGPGFMKHLDLDHGLSGEIFGDVLHTVFKPESAFEFGCGTGRTSIALRRHGVNVTCCDGSEAAKNFIAQRDPELAKKFFVNDLGTAVTLASIHDLVVCVEVLEHLPEARADMAVNNLCRAGQKIVVTACPPVGRNPLHLNEQPFLYWVEKFEEQGVKLHVPYTKALATIMRALYDLHAAGCYPLIPAWFFSGYIGVFSH